MSDLRENIKALEERQREYKKELDILLSSEGLEAVFKSQLRKDYCEVETRLIVLRCALKEQEKNK